MNMSSPPPQPDDSHWRFVDELKAPFWTPRPRRRATPDADQADISRGIQLLPTFADTDGLLETALTDLLDCLDAWGVPRQTDSGYSVRLSILSELSEEAFRITVGPDECSIEGGDIEGIRRGIFRFEALLDRAGGPFLPLGVEEKHPFIRRRISRCFFGPIKRPPRLRDELLDDVDYYPENYLNRLTHEGVNGLWLTVAFRELCRTRFTPDAAPDRDRRLAKLRRTVERCRRYGIRTYLFTIEPRAWGGDNSLPVDFPELGGGAYSANGQYFCPMTASAAEYLHESVFQIFRDVPGLGGLINISHGERATTSLSALTATGEGQVRCPRCSRKAPWEILYAALDAMARGMHAAAPDAELISWLYMPQTRGPHGTDLAPWVYEVPAHTPDGVILQFNFETGVRRDFFGTERVGGDYWLSVPGPSDRFERVARGGAQAGTPISAKIQTGCSHEVADIPFIPVPGHLHDKFAGMHRLGVRYAMLCWYFGNYPGVMNQAAGELSFEPFIEDRDVFLLELARRDWGDYAPRVVEAWQYFSRGYSNYPLTNLFQYYGPMHDGPVWPLLLEPADTPLAPTWLLGSTVTREPYPPSGDRIGECFMFAYTLDEIVELCRRMSRDWARGVAVLERFEPHFRDKPERLLDIGLARALGIQFRSGWNILQFYAIREEMLRLPGNGRLDCLERLAAIIEDELSLDAQLLELCRKDSRLGFHSEAEGYKYYPEKIEWRMQQLRRVLLEDMPKTAETIRRGAPLFPEYTGHGPTGPRIRCTLCGPEPATRTGTPPDIGSEPLDWQRTGACRWTVCRDDNTLQWLIVGSKEPPEEVRLRIEPRRLWPCLHFVYSTSNELGSVDEIPDRVAPRRLDGVLRKTGGDGWRLTLRIPFSRIHVDPTASAPVRANVRIRVRDGGVSDWVAETPWQPRLRLGSDNPRNLGWVLFDVESRPSTAGQ